MAGAPPQLPMAPTGMLPGPPMAQSMHPSAGMTPISGPGGEALTAPQLLMTGRVAGLGPAPSDDNRLKKVYVSPLGEDATQDVIRMCFEGFGAILRVNVCTSAGDSGHKYAFVEFETEDAAKRAISFSGKLPVGRETPKVRPCREQGPTTDVLGLRPQSRPAKMVENEWQYTHQLADASALYRMWKDDEHEKRAKQLRTKRRKELKRKRRDGSSSDGSSFDSGESTEERRKRKGKKKDSRKAKRRHSNSSDSGSDSSGSLPEPPRKVFYG
ncbi:hypothetical protein DIPPA_31299 [Diplonema papillatum]|nr:hypothetical protein DIPPA_31299 [Diplonema papillatum]